MDILIAMVIFVGGVIIFLTLILGSSNKDLTERLTTESEILPESLMATNEVSANNATFIIGNKVDTDRLQKNLAKPYTELKREMDVVSDFCIHFEDENGHLVDLNDEPCIVQYSVGNPRMNLTIKDQIGNDIMVSCGNYTVIC